MFLNLSHAVFYYFVVHVHFAAILETLYIIAVCGTGNYIFERTRRGG